jgi:two-component system CheB/CheR fusion protein
MKHRVFELFSQVDQSLDRAKGGLGIGLTLSRWLAELHGGRLEAESAGVGKGSTFTLVLPQRTHATTPKDEPQAQLSAVQQAERQVLLVDDNTDTCLSLAKILGSEGFLVHTAVDGEEALRRVEELQPDIILLDIGLPKRNGYEVARLLREDPRFEATPIVALSGYGQSHHRIRSFQAGFDLHFLKPINTDALLQAMNGFSLPIKQG